MSFRTDSTFADLFIPSPNSEERANNCKIDLLILHYTATESTTHALNWLTEPESRVSSHYLVGENGGIIQMVQEKDRAWHAGDSYWAGESDINSCSIGIEIQNLGHDSGLPAYPDIQMQSVIRLCLDIITRHSIPVERVLGHSDVAPHRKRDPGENFDWARLYRSGIGYWVAPIPPGEEEGLKRGDEGKDVALLQSDLKSFGFKIDV
ncbi:MAG: N-acetylmuramoyl-L-alanine amidase, partial [Desulfobulbia bacterium]